MRRTVTYSFDYLAQVVMQRGITAAGYAVVMLSEGLRNASPQT